MIQVYIVIPLLVLLILLLTAGNIFYSMVLKPGGFARFSKNKIAPPPDPFFAEAKNWWSNMPVEELVMKSRNGLNLRGYYIKNSSGSNRLAFLIHGYTGKATEMACYARIYYELGFDIFAPDHRAHGKSEGNAIGMGWLDSGDCLKWLEFLRARSGHDFEIIVHGQSMGGTTTLLMAGRGLLPDVKGVISDCAFESTKGILACQLKKMYNLPAFPLLYITSLVCKLRAGYFFGDADAVKYVKYSKTPMLFIHGDKDSFVPVSMVHTLFNAAEPSLRELWIVGGAGHIQSVKVDNEGYFLHIKTFVERNFTCQTDNLLIK